MSTHTKFRPIQLAPLPSATRIINLLTHTRLLSRLPKTLPSFSSDHPLTSPRGTILTSPIPRAIFVANPVGRFHTLSVLPSCSHHPTKPPLYGRHLDGPCIPRRSTKCPALPSPPRPRAESKMAKLRNREARPNRTLRQSNTSTARPTPASPVNEAIESINAIMVEQDPSPKPINQEGPLEVRKEAASALAIAPALHRRVNANEIVPVPRRCLSLSESKLLNSRSVETPPPLPNPSGRMPMVTK